MITQIDPQSVDKITSGQVVTSVASAIKELLENSLDAGATVVDIRIINHGRDGFSVQDNGSGIAPDDFDLVGTKHATSKLHSFADLGNVATLGFRGEALASLCALAQVVICTNGYRLEMAPDGTVASRKRIPTPTGTLVSVSDLFSHLPVRRKDLERNYQREFSKAVALIQEYAVISPVRLTLEHSHKNRTSTVLRSQGSELIHRIACVYGGSRVTSLMPVELSVDVKDCIRVSGYISQPVFGKGDPSTDRQLMYISGRPTRQQRIARTITEVYKQFNLSENPCFVLNLQVPLDSVDVNVTPDKRIVLLHDEARIIQDLREAFVQHFESAGHSVPRAANTQPPPPKRARQTFISLNRFAGSGSVMVQDDSDEDVDFDTTPSREVVETPVDGAINDHNAEVNGRIEVTSVEPTKDYNEMEVVPPSASNKESSAGVLRRPEHSSNKDNGQTLRENLASFAAGAPFKSTPPAGRSGRKSTMSHDNSMEVNQTKFTGRQQRLQTGADELPGFMPASEVFSGSTMTDSGDSLLGNEIGSKEQNGNSYQILPSEIHESESGRGHELNPSVQSFLDQQPRHVQSEESVQLSRCHHDHNHTQVHSQSPLQVQSQSRSQLDPEQDLHRSNSTVSGQITKDTRTRKKGNRPFNKHISLPTSIDAIREAAAKLEPQVNTTTKVKQFAVDESNAEERLSLTVRKEDFNQMRVVGQFNLGFILVVKASVSGKHRDLFVIDQHASDEIYNFERLQRTTVLSRQPLVIPQPLELSAVEELTVIEHMSVFENNGFSISVDSTAPPGKQCRITAKPYSKNTVFDERDVHELIYRLREAPENSGVRCTKLRAMFAMRACRSSIMIGRPLSMSTMERVVTNLGTLDKPWNCPHGRPTLRHITSLT